MLHRKLILFSTGNRYTLQLVKLNDVFLTQDVSESVLCASRNLTQRNKKNNASCSKKDCQSCERSVCREHALRISEYCNNKAN